MKYGEVIAITAIILAMIGLGIFFVIKKKTLLGITLLIIGGIGCLLLLVLSIRSWLHFKNQYSMKGYTRQQVKQLWNTARQERPKKQQQIILRKQYLSKGYTKQQVNQILDTVQQERPKKIEEIKLRKQGLLTYI